MRGAATKVGVVAGEEIAGFDVEGEFGVRVGGEVHCGVRSKVYTAANDAASVFPPSQQAHGGAAGLKVTAAPHRLSH
jgi:hypothetical protein